MYVAFHNKYHIILAKFMEYGYQGLDPGLMVLYLLSGIMCDKLFMAVAAVRAYPDKYKKDFNTVVAFLTQYVDKRASALSVKVVSVAQTRPAKWQKTIATCDTFKEKIESKKYSKEEYN